MNAGDGCVAVVSGPGSGKTTVLCARYQRLRETIPVDDILSLTFTASAAKNMRDRAQEKQVGGRPSGFMTFHAFCLAVASREHEHFRYPLQANPLATPGQAAKMLGEVCRRQRLDFRDLQSFISRQKRQYRCAAEALNEAEAQGVGIQQALGYKEYETKLRDAGLLDFDSLLLEVVCMFEAHPDIQDRYQFKYVMVDEFQDTDEVQIRLLQLLTEKFGNLLAVGDTNQSIYAFRGASGDALLNFRHYFPDAQTIYLNNNYRSTKAITDWNYEIAPHRPPERYETPNEDGEAPEIVACANELLEVQAVIDRLGWADRAPKLFDIGGPPNLRPDINAAVLARTNQALRVFEERFSESGIRYHLLGRAGYWSQPEVRNCLAYIQCADVPTDAAITGAMSAPFYPSKFLKKKDILENLKRTSKRTSELNYWSALQYYQCDTDSQQRSLSGFRTFIRNLSPYRLLSAGTAVAGVLTDLRAMEYYAEEEENLDNDPVANLRELVKIAQRFATIGDFLAHVRRIKAATKVKKGVALGTIHSAKGLEWSAVFLTSCSQGILPHIKAESLEEEQRIWFVGCSRAADRLVITYSGTPSQFIRQALPHSQEELCSRAF